MGTPIGFARARTIVSRACSYRDYGEVAIVSWDIEKPVSDYAVKRIELKNRYATFSHGLTKCGFTKTEAATHISNVSTESWRGHRGGKSRQRPIARTAASVLDNPEPVWERLITVIAPSSIKFSLENLGIAKKMERDLSAFAKDNDLEIIGRNDLMAKLFGHESFADLEASMEDGVPSDQDWIVPIEELGMRVDEYFRILMACGFTAGHTGQALCTVGVDGW